MRGREAPELYLKRMYSTRPRHEVFVSATFSSVVRVAQWYTTWSPFLLYPQCISLQLARNAVDYCREFVLALARSAVFVAVLVALRSDTHCRNVQGGLLRTPTRRGTRCTPQLSRQLLVSMEARTDRASLGHIARLPDGEYLRAHGCTHQSSSCRTRSPIYQIPRLEHMNQNPHCDGRNS